MLEINEEVKKIEIKVKLLIEILGRIKINKDNKKEIFAT